MVLFLYRLVVPKNESKTTYKTTVPKKLNDFNWYYSEGQRLFGANLMDAAIEYFDKALNIKSTPELWNSEGLAYLVKGKKLDAINCFNNALNLDDRFSPAIHNKAETIKNLSF